MNAKKKTQDTRERPNLTKNFETTRSYSFTHARISPRTCLWNTEEHYKFGKKKKNEMGKSLPEYKSLKKYAYVYVL